MAGDPWTHVRSILVPPDIVGVKASSPAGRRRPSTPCRPHTEGVSITARPGQRDWFSDRVFVESQDGHASTGYGTSLIVHAAMVAALLAYVIAQPQQFASIASRSGLTMPVVVAPIPVVVEAPAVRASDLRPATAPRPVPVAVPPPPPPPMVAEARAPTASAAPIVEPPAVGADTDVNGGPDVGATSGDDRGVAGGSAGGVPGGLPGAAAAAAGPPAPAVVRVGSDMRAPRKIKDVRPVYPDGALTGRGRGSVIIEAVIGADGRVRQARIVSPPSVFDQAALDAVRQWEYEPPILNGAAVAVAITIAVNFSLQ
jgi:periplasmic protein TonB